METNNIIFGEDSDLYLTEEIMSVSIETDCRLPSHPVEDGTVAADTVGRGPLRISVTVILDPEKYIETYDQIKQLNTDMLKCTIYNKADTHENMYLENYPHQEDASKFDTIEMELKFIQQITVTVDTEGLSTNDVEDPAETDAGDRGQQLPESETNLAGIGPEPELG